MPRSQAQLHEAEDEQQRLVDNIAGSLAGVSREDIIGRALSHFREADSSYGERVEAAVKELRS
jgi:catalase